MGNPNMVLFAVVVTFILVAAIISWSDRNGGGGMAI